LQSLCQLYAPKKLAGQAKILSGFIRR
jgi:hypothetical protein